MNRLWIISLLVAAGIIITASPGHAEAQLSYRAHYRGHYRGHHHGRGHIGIALLPRGLYFGAGVLGTRILSQDGGSLLTACFTGWIDKGSFSLRSCLYHRAFSVFV